MAFKSVEVQYKLIKSLLSAISDLLANKPEQVPPPGNYLTELHFKMTKLSFQIKYLSPPRYFILAFVFLSSL